MIRTVGLLAVVFCFVAPTPGSAQVADHLKCYKVKDALKLAGTADLDTPQFGADAGCTVSKATLFCVPATKTNVAVTDKATGLPIAPLPISGPQPGDRVCYKVKCPNPVVPIADQSVTDQFGNRTVSKFKAALVCTPAFKGSARYVDNGDGTVTDNYTGLQWEMKDGADDEENLANPHDVDNRYSWCVDADSNYSCDSASNPPDGTAFTDFLGKLNNCTSTDGTAVTGGFAGHCDWRLPTIAELQTIRLEPYPCGTSPCIDSTFGPTAASGYWSSTFNANPAGFAWVVLFQNGLVYNDFGHNGGRARAVRGGS